MKIFSSRSSTARPIVWTVDIHCKKNQKELSKLEEDIEYAVKEATDEIYEVIAINSIHNEGHLLIQGDENGAKPDLNAIKSLLEKRLNLGIISIKCYSNKSLSMSSSTNQASIFSSLVNMIIIAFDASKGSEKLLSQMVGSLTDQEVTSINKDLSSQSKLTKSQSSLLFTIKAELGKRNLTASLSMSSEKTSGMNLKGDERGTPVTKKTRDGLSKLISKLEIEDFEFKDAFLKENNKDVFFMTIEVYTDYAQDDILKLASALENDKNIENIVSSDFKSNKINVVDSFIARKAKVRGMSSFILQIEVY